MTGPPIPIVAVMLPTDPLASPDKKGFLTIAILSSFFTYENTCMGDQARTITETPIQVEFL
ncbi:hypothetical protein ES703_79490 [subsurface metagenome]